MVRDACAKTCGLCQTPIPKPTTATEASDDAFGPATDPIIIRVPISDDMSKILASRNGTSIPLLLPTAPKPTPPANGVYGTTSVMHEGWLYSVLPYSPMHVNSASKGQGEGRHTLGDDEEVVDIQGADWADVRESVIKPYSWVTMVLVCRDSSDGTWPAYKTAGFRFGDGSPSGAGERFAEDLSWITWTNGGRTFEFSDEPGRVLVRKRHPDY